jgi:predicted metal-dependent phosphotriesterase family hydrolase
MQTTQATEKHTKTALKEAKNVKNGVEKMKINPAKILICHQI